MFDKKFFKISMQKYNKFLLDHPFEPTIKEKNR